MSNTIWIISTGTSSYYNVTQNDLMKALDGAELYGSDGYDAFKKGFIDFFLANKGRALEFGKKNKENIMEIRRLVQSGRPFAIGTEDGFTYGFGVSLRSAELIRAEFILANSVDTDEQT